MSKKSASVSLLACAVLSCAAIAQTTQPAASAPAAQATAGTYETIQAHAKATNQQYLALVPNTEFLADANAAKRDAVAAQAIPLLKTVLSDLDGMIEANPSLKRQILAVRLNEEGQLYALGDAEAVSALEAKAKAGGPDGDMATNVILRGRWYRAGKDPALQADVITALDKAAAAQTKDVFLSQFICDIRPQAVYPEMKQHLMELMTGTMDNPTAKALVKVMQNADKTSSFEGKPLVLSGKLPDGKDFTTADWKGKVILVDFWAVWCARVVRNCRV
ncbi:MAG: hypothetical protein QM770_20605 [Tepidisphaeraceae bacterium]